MPESVASSFLSRVGGSRSTLSKEYKATVQLLDDNETLTVEFKKGDTGQVIFDYVCECLNIAEKDYFGLRFMDNYKNRYWLDPGKPVLRQIKGTTSGLVLRFRVKYYPRDPAVLREEITRYTLFLQLRRDLLHGRLYAPQADAATLGAYIIQSELGEYSAEEHAEGYVSEYKLFLKQTGKLEDRIASVHPTLGDITPAQAELLFLKKAASLDTYGYDPYTVKDAKGAQLYLGVTHQGILVYQSNRKIHHIPWDDLDKVDYIGKEFTVSPKASYTANLNASAGGNAPNSPSTERPDGDDATISEGEEEHADPAPTAAPVDTKQTKQDDKDKKAGLLRFTCPSGSFCKHLWKYTLSQEAFFTKKTHSEVKEVHSKARIPIFARGSTFRFNGRVLAEIKEGEVPVRDEPSFVRYHLERQPSRADRGFPWMNKYSTLPRLRPKPQGEDEARSAEAPASLERTRSPDDVRETLSAESPAFSGLGSPSEEDRSFLDHPPTTAPLSNSTPLKAPPPVAEEEDDFKEVNDVRQRKVSSQPKPATNGSTKPLPPSSPAQAKPKKSERGLCGWLVVKLLTLVMVTMVVAGMVAVVMEVSDRDSQWRRYAHSVPGLEAFRYRVYNPTRSSTLRVYRNVLGD